MDNKYLILAGLLSLIGAFFDAPIRKKITNKETNKIEKEAEICIDSLRHLNDSLIHDLRMQNRVLKTENTKLKRIRKHQW